MKELDHQREEYRKSVEPLEAELSELEDARARLTGEGSKSRKANGDRGSGGGSVVLGIMSRKPYTTR